MRTIKRLLRSVALMSLLLIGLGVHELTWADVSPGREGGSSTMEFKAPPIKSEKEKAPPMDCVVKKTETICVRKNDRIEMDRFLDQSRKMDFVKADMFQQIIR